MIAVVDYGAGNLRSVSNTLDALGQPHALVRSAEDLARASKIVLPGVGHFGQMMTSIDALGLRQSLRDAAVRGVPLLGICLGMQALFEGSEEAPGVNGLGLFPGVSVRFPLEFRVPQMGWNRVTPRPGSRLFGQVSSSIWFYFAHSFYVPETPARAATCEYEVEYTAAVEQGNIFGVQFHPEKSAAAGQELVRRFLDL